MVILNQIVGVGDFSIVDNLRLFIIAAIFVGIIAVLLYLRYTRSGEKANGKNISKVKIGEEIDDVGESAEGTEGASAVNLETIEEKIKKTESEMITKSAEVIKNVRAKIDTKLVAEAEEIRAEFTVKIEELILKIEERERETVKKIEDVIDVKVQEALNKMGDRISVALHTQKSSTASVLEKLVDSLRTEEVQAGSLASVKAENGIDGKGAESEKQGSKATGSSNIEKALKSDESESRPDGISGTNETQKEKAFVSSDISEGTTENTADSDMQGLLDEEPEVPSEDNADMELEKDEPIAAPGNNEGNVSEPAVEDADDFDLQEFLDAEPVGHSSSGESDVAVEEDIVSGAITEDGLEVPSEDKTDIESEGNNSIASSGEIEEKVLESTGGDTVDFDIQEFLDELENLPSENDLETEK